ncbi:MAG: hypoxanthine phosphoribosyltransferase [Bacteroidota bacterium]
MSAIQIHDLHFMPYLSAAEIQARIEVLGQQIHRDHQDHRPVFVGILNGAFIFLADLVRAANIACEIAFMRVSSYEGTASTGVVKTIDGLSMEVKNRHVIIVEDIVDTGRTMQQLLTDFAVLEVASVSVATLLLKPDALLFPDLPLDYVGFEIPNKFVVGYGLDYNELGRNWNQIYQLVD